MALPTSRTELIDYALRALGSPVINIEYDEDQLNDRIDYAMRKFIDRHYDGASEMFMFVPVTKSDYENGYITLPSSVVSVLQVIPPASEWSIEPFDSIEYYTMWDYTFGYGSGTGTMQHYYITRQHLALVNMMMGQGYSIFYNTVTKRLKLNYDKSYVGSSNIFSNTTIEDAAWTKTNCTVLDNTTAIPNGNLEATEITSAGAGTFGVGYSKESQNYTRGAITTEVILMSGTYTGDVDIIMEDRNGLEVARKTVPLKNYWVKHDLQGIYAEPAINDCVIRYETTGAAAGAGETFSIWAPCLYTNSFVVIHGYEAIDPDSFEDVWSQEWVMKYVTALCKYQWGSNIKKYQGVQLPGGIEMTGQQIFDEANEEIRLLDEQFSDQYELPLDFYWG